ncbi:MAG: OmpA family protein [Bacteroidota bacterium]
MYLQKVFTAGGGEKDLTIGNFRKNDDPNLIPLESQAMKHKRFQTCSYYYVDDVAVHEIGVATCPCPAPPPVAVVEPPSSTGETPALPAAPAWKSGDTLTLRGIHFAFGTDLLPESSFSGLDSLADHLTANPDLAIRIEGHTDHIGKDDYNLRLSQSRAEGIQNYLLQKGIALSRMKATGKGETQPISDNATSEGRALNRRVEVHFQ